MILNSMIWAGASEVLKAPFYFSLVDRITFMYSERFCKVSSRACLCHLFVWVDICFGLLGFF